MLQEELLRKLREAVAYQIGLWDTAHEISEKLDCDLDTVLDYVQSAAIVADSGMELTQDDLDELMGIGIPGRIVVGRPLPPSRIQ
jgi:hypothetical protein